MRLPDFPHLECKLLRTRPQPHGLIVVLVSCFGLSLTLEIAALEPERIDLLLIAGAQSTQRSVLGLETLAPLTGRVAPHTGGTKLFGAERRPVLLVIPHLLLE